VTRLALLTLQKEEHEFSAGHFTIFSETEREDLHGHNYSVSVDLHVSLRENGLAFDYRLYKQKLTVLCKQLDRRFLLPAHSPYLRLEEMDDMWFAHFANERIPFLKRDVIILPICNVTIEELSYWFLQQLILDPTELNALGIQKIMVKVFNGPGQSGGACYDYFSDSCSIRK